MLSRASFVQLDDEAYCFRHLNRLAQREIILGVRMGCFKDPFSRKVHSLAGESLETIEQIYGRCALIKDLERFFKQEYYVD